MAYCPLASRACRIPPAKIELFGVSRMLNIHIAAQQQPLQPKMGSLRIWHSPTNQSLRRFAVSNHRTRSWIKVDQSSQPLVLTQHTLWNHVQALKIKSWRKAQIHIWNDLTITNLNLRRHVFIYSCFTHFKVGLYIYKYTIDYIYYVTKILNYSNRLNYSLRRTWRGLLLCHTSRSLGGSELMKKEVNLAENPKKWSENRPE
jgi:hypothetical protein